MRRELNRASDEKIGAGLRPWSVRLFEVSFMSELGEIEQMVRSLNVKA